MSNAQDINLTAVGDNLPLSGLGNTFGNVNYDANTFANNSDLQYEGPYSASFDGVAILDADNAVTPENYIGPMGSYGITITAGLPEVNSALNDNQPILTWPKDQQIYYKLAGFNTSTLTYETWIIAEEIVPRPETFDPTGNFPNVDLNVYFTPPSGNPLVNVKIIGRWIQ